MKYGCFVLVVLCALAGMASGFPVDEDQDRVNGENGWYVPQIDDTFEWVDAADFDLDENNESIQGRNVLNPVTFYLYTQDNPDDADIIRASKKSIDASHFNPENPTRVSIHGWRSGSDDYINEGVRDAWLGKGDYNYIFVEWGRASFIDYASATYAVSGVGEQCAALLDFLVENYGLDLNDLVIVGHSLGAHAAGFTGKNIKSGQVHTIVGLDPALPLFKYNKPHQRLADTDAFYVESIQTNGDKLGFLKPIGKGAFYPNGGKKQPGCKNDITGACSHSRSIEYYVEALENGNFGSIKCESYEVAVAKNCGSTFTTFFMAHNTNPYVVEGEFYVPVNKEYPYAMFV